MLNRPTPNEARGPRPRERGAQPHGWWRAGDRGGKRIALPTIAVRRRIGVAPLLASVIVCIAIAAGIARVRARNRVLELGAELTDLTAEHMRLLETRRRLEAERAYLRHPDRIEDAARTEHQMIPIVPQRLYRIRMHGPAEGQ